MEHIDIRFQIGRTGLFFVNETGTVYELATEADHASMKPRDKALAAALLGLASSQTLGYDS